MRVRLKDFDTRETSGLAKEESLPIAEEDTHIIGDLAYRLYAENSRVLLIVLQGMDTAGKDGSIRHLMRCVNAQATEVIPFKKPSSEELDHDYSCPCPKMVPPQET